jgi:hypothetical protein
VRVLRAGLPRGNHQQTPGGNGWRGSIIEQLKIIEPLTNPTAHGASAHSTTDRIEVTSRARS